jgi:hypothetical protein
MVTSEHATGCPADTPPAAEQVSDAAPEPGEEDGAAPEWFDDVLGVDGDRLRAIDARLHHQRALNWAPRTIEFLFTAMHGEYRRAQYLRDLLDRVAACAVCVCGTEEGVPDRCPVCEAAGVPL